MSVFTMRLRFYVHHMQSLKETGKLITLGVHSLVSGRKSLQCSSQLPLDDEVHLLQFYFLILEGFEL